MAMARHGVRPGDVLAPCAPNSIEFAVTLYAVTLYAVTLYAATSAGATVTTVNPQWTSQEIGRQLRGTGARHPDIPLTLTRGNGANASRAQTLARAGRLADEDNWGHIRHGPRRPHIAVLATPAWALICVHQRYGDVISDFPV